MNFLKVALVWMAVFAFAGLFAWVFGEAAIYILGLGGVACLIYAIYTSGKPTRHDHNFPEPPDDFDL